MKRIVFLLSFVLFNTNLVYSAQDAVDTQTEIFDDFSKGLVTELPSHKIIKSASPAMKNVLIDEINGTLITRNGYETLNSTYIFNKITHIVPYYKENGQKSYIVSDSSSVLETTDWLVFTVLKTQLNYAYPLSVKQIWNKMWFTNGADDVFNYDGSTLVILNGATYGDVTTPDIPKCKYIEEYQGRVFMAGESSNPSGLYMSNLVSTDAIIVAPDDNRAWTSTNRLDIAKGDGTIITGMFKESGLLHIGKEGSIHTIYGSDETNYRAVNNNPDVGIISNLSVATVDGAVYFQGSDGINKFSNGLAVRISDPIRTVVNNAAKNVSAVVSNIWETKTHFNRGTFYKTTTTLTSNDILTINTTYQWNNNSQGLAVSIELANFLATTATAWNPLIIASVPANINGIISTITVQYKNMATIAPPNLITIITLKNTDSDQFTLFSTTLSGKVTTGDSDTGRFYVRPNTPDRTNSPLNIKSADINGGKILFKIEIDTQTSVIPSTCTCSNVVNVSSFSKFGYGEIWITTNCGQYISEVATNTTITYWDNFETIQETNGGDIDYFIMTGTSAQWITLGSTAVWKSITPNTLITSPITEKYVRWATSITAWKWDTPPVIDKVEVKHNEGLSTSFRSCGVSWNNRYWILLSTYNDYSNPFVLVKSKGADNNSWSYFDGLNVLTLYAFGNLLYGGSRTDGTLYLMDTGTNDNGTAIDAYYDTPDWSFGRPFNDKTLRQYLVDFEAGKTDTLQIGTSIDGGLFSYKNVDASGSGRKGQAIYQISNAYGKTFRFRFRCNELDQKLYLYGFGCKYQNRDTQSGATLK